ncbi:MAG: glycosyltransferase family 87 protein [Pseudomonadota bacterium]
MNGFPPVWQRIRTGGWVTVERMRAYSIILIAVVTITAGIGISRLDDWVADDGKPIGTDFTNTYAAGVLAHQGRAADAYDPAIHHEVEKAIFNRDDVPLFTWNYPPYFFAVAALVAFVPYAWALLLWVAASLTAYLAAIRLILPRPETWLYALAFPASFVNIGHGQNGFLTAALIGGALHVMPRRPWLAGFLIGCLIYKPQFGLLIPLCLMADRRWTTIAAAALSVTALTALSVAVLGVDIWKAFLASTDVTQRLVFESGTTGWEKFQSVFSAVRAWHGSLVAAYMAQTVLTLLLAVSLAWLWTSNAAYDLKASALATASLLATPYALDYDMVVLAVSIAFFVRHGLAHGFRDYEISVLAAAWIVPLFARTLGGLTTIPFGLAVMLLLFAITIRRAAADTGLRFMPRRSVAQA